MTGVVRPRVNQSVAVLFAIRRRGLTVILDPGGVSLTGWEGSEERRAGSGELRA